MIKAMMSLVIKAMMSVVSGLNDLLMISEVSWLHDKSNNVSCQWVK